MMNNAKVQSRLGSETSEMVRYVQTRSGQFSNGITVLFDVHILRSLRCVNDELNGRS